MLRHRQLYRQVQNQRRLRTIAPNRQGPRDQRLPDVARANRGDLGKSRRLR
jgi:hypothetical protein